MDKIVRDGLTERQIKFCHEYLIDLNQRRAATRAGYTEQNAWRIFNLGPVQAYLRPLLEKMHQKTLATAEGVLEELTCMAMSNIATFYKRVGKRWKLKDLDELTPLQQRCISEVEPGKFIKLYSKDSALDKLAKHFKLYTDLDAAVTQFNIMPVLRINGKEVIFEVGKPAPQPKPQKN